MKELLYAVTEARGRLLEELVRDHEVFTPQYIGVLYARNWMRVSLSAVGAAEHFGLPGFISAYVTKMVRTYRMTEEELGGRAW